MSQIEIPQEFIDAWRYVNRVYVGPGDDVWHEKKVHDFVVWAIAGWMRSEFEREHRMGRLLISDIEHCFTCNMNNSRHNWTEKQWQDAARERLAGK